MILYSEKFNEWTINIKPNVISVERMDEDGYLSSRSFIGYTLEEVKEILTEE